MQRALFIVFGLAVALTLAGLAIAFARPVKWPANVARAEWRRALGEKVDQVVEEVAA